MNVGSPRYAALISCAVDGVDIAAAFAVGLGADVVVFASPHEHLRSAAAGYGATAVEAIGPDLGTFDVTVETSGVADALAAALRMTGPSGVCICTAGAVHRGGDVPVPVYEMYMNPVTFHTGWGHPRSVMDEPVALIADRLFDPLAIPGQAESEETRARA